MNNASSSTLASSSLSHKVTRRLLLVWLPIIIVGSLIFWLSGGMPPASWLLLIEMVSRWSGLRVSMGNGVFIPFIIVLVQCLCILIAWIILVFTIWREVSVFNTLRAQQRIVTLQKNMAAAENATTPALSENQGVQWMLEEQGMNLFEEEDLSVQPKNTGIRIVSGGSEEHDDSFDVNKAVFELPLGTDESEADEAPAQPQQAKEEETVFVYGNPFDGELPEVFHYDMDLKRGIQNIQEELRGQRKIGEENITESEEKRSNEKDIQDSQGEKQDSQGEKQDSQEEK